MAPGRFGFPNLAAAVPYFSGLFRPGWDGNAFGSPRRSAATGRDAPAFSPHRSMSTRPQLRAGEPSRVHHVVRASVLGRPDTNSARTVWRAARPTRGNTPMPGSGDAADRSPSAPIAPGRRPGLARCARWPEVFLSTRAGASRGIEPASHGVPRGRFAGIRTGAGMKVPTSKSNGLQRPADRADDRRSG